MSERLESGQEDRSSCYGRLVRCVCILVTLREFWKYQQSYWAGLGYRAEAASADDPGFCSRITAWDGGFLPLSFPPSLILSDTILLTLSREHSFNHLPFACILQMFHLSPKWASQERRAPCHTVHHVFNLKISLTHMV